MEDMILDAMKYVRGVSKKGIQRSSLNFKFT